MKNNRILIIALLLLSGLALRIYRLGNESIWIDEGFSIMTAHLDLSSFFANFTNYFNPPLYYLFLHCWIGMFGDAESSVRLPSVIFSFFSMVMIYRTCSMLFNKDVGLFSMLLLSMSPFHIFYAQEARAYSLMVLLSLLSMYFFIRLIDSLSAKSSAGYVVCSALMMYTHNYGFFVLVAQNLYFFTLPALTKSFKFRPMHWLLLQLLTATLYLPPLYVMIKKAAIINAGGHYWLSRPTFQTLLKTFADYSAYSQILLLLFVFLISFSFIKHGKAGNSEGTLQLDTTSTDRIYLLLLWLVIPVILPFLISQASTPIYHPRYTIAASVPFYILAAKGLQNINDNRVKYAITILILFFSSSAIIQYDYQANKQQWRDAVKYIEANAAPSDLVLIAPGDAKKTTFDYYSKRVDLTKDSFPPSSLWDNITEKNVNALGPAVQEHERVWFVLSFNPNSNSIIRDKFESLHFDLIYYGDYGGSGWKGLLPKNLDIYLFKKKKS